mmetsp:Transcript_52080/g.145361  ORF Transcript_52080/g.145361 Transcript_52080/m.145361 type:complete len:209 (-) Transcript_52080:36-662(-)
MFDLDFSAAGELRDITVLREACRVPIAEGLLYADLPLEAIQRLFPLRQGVESGAFQATPQCHQRVVPGLDRLRAPRRARTSHGGSGNRENAHNTCGGEEVSCANWRLHRPLHGRDVLGMHWRRPRVHRRFFWYQGHTSTRLVRDEGDTCTTNQEGGAKHDSDSSASLRRCHGRCWCASPQVGICGGQIRHKQNAKNFEKISLASARKP